MSEWYHDALVTTAHGTVRIEESLQYEPPERDYGSGWTVIEDRDDFFAVVWTDDLELGYVVLNWWIRKEA